MLGAQHIPTHECWHRFESKGGATSYTSEFMNNICEILAVVVTGCRGSVVRAGMTPGVVRAGLTGVSV